MIIGRKLNGDGMLDLMRFRIVRRVLDKNMNPGNESFAATCLSVDHS